MSHNQEKGHMSYRIFQVLMILYPKRFRSEYATLMVQHFEDLEGGGLRYWMWIVRDMVSGSLREHLADWRQQMSKMTLIAAGILMLPLGFVLVNVLQYEIGIPIPWNPYNSVYDQVSGTGWTHLFDAVILFSPIVAALIVVLSQVRISGGEGKTVLARIEIQRASRLAYVVVGSSVALLGVMGLYVVFENLPCLLGQQVIC